MLLTAVMSFIGHAAMDKMAAATFKRIVRGNIGGFMKLLARVVSFVLTIFLFAISSTAQAIPYSLQFSFTDFNFLPPVDPPPAAPVTTVSGTVFFDKSPTSFSLLSLTSIDLTIAGHSYSIPPVTATIGTPRVTIGPTVILLHSTAVQSHL